MVVTVGVCCMDAKVFSRPMRAILNRLKRYEDLSIVTFGNRCIFDKPVEAWPIVDFLICFYSAGFPLAKAEEYVRLRNPVCFNDVLSLVTLLDRTAVYAKLRANAIPVPPYEVFAAPDHELDFRKKLLEERHADDSLSPSSSASLLPTPPISAVTTVEDQQADGEEKREDEERKAKYWGPGDPIQENEDCITVNGRKFKKPFVEKPVFAEDHNIYIYYPRSSGGGSKRLFRKIGDRSSKFYPNVSTVRRGETFIYEEFVTTDGADIKVYTVGPDYAHAEARKAPTVDGRVKRTADGKEVRYHVILTQAEKELARKITQIFGQNICGFDLLRSDGITYVCDVNGWSFVKGLAKYYNDAAQIIYEMIHFNLHPLAPAGLLRTSASPDSATIPAAEAEDRRGKELRCVLAVIRHGDRTPKQKVKVKVTHPRILAFFEGKDSRVQVRIKSAKEMGDFAEALSKVLSEDSDAVLAPDPAQAPLLDASVRRALLAIHDEIQKEKDGHFSGINRKVQIKPLGMSAGAPSSVNSAMLIFKFGGQLTEYGSRQVDWLAKRFRTKIYAAEGAAGGMVSLHSSFAHDIKFYSSDEGRVQMTAALFAKSFLELDEEEIIPILYALVWNDKRSNMLLEHSSSGSTAMAAERARISEIMNSDVDFSENNKELDPKRIFGGVTVEELRKLGLGKLGNPYRQLARLNSAIRHLCVELGGKAKAKGRASPIPWLASPATLTAGASPSHDGPASSPIISKMVAATCPAPAAAPGAAQLWSHLLKTFFDETTNRFDASKVSDAFDLARFGMLHHRDLSASFRIVHDLALPLAAWTVTQRYGISTKSKLEIASEVVSPLMDKLVSDLRQMREKPQLQTVSRFYFTSESHLHCLHNLFESRLRMPMSGDRVEDYVAHWCIRMYEDMSMPISSAQRFLVEIWHSPGSNAANVPDPPGNPHNFIIPLRPVALNMTLDDFVRHFSSSPPPPAPVPPVIYPQVALLTPSSQAPFRIRTPPTVPVATPLLIPPIKLGAVSTFGPTPI